MRDLRTSTRKLLTLVSLILIASSCDFAGAESDVDSDEDRIGIESLNRAPAAVQRNGVPRKRYPGGVDEDDLQVQVALPLPSKTADGLSAPAHAGADDASDTETTPPPAND